VTTTYTERDGRYYRAGLVYEPEGHGSRYLFSPDGPFFVDGIRYEQPLDDDVIYIRPMVELMPLRGGATSTFMHKPLTDAELDEWVRHG
jgi:hypothetical protein